MVHKLEEDLQQLMEEKEKTEYLLGHKLVDAKGSSFSFKAEVSELCSQVQHLRIVVLEVDGRLI